MRVELQKHNGAAEMYFIGELISKIINAMQIDGNVELYSREPRDWNRNGLFQLLDEMCSYWNWKKSCIILSTPDPWLTHNEYRIVCNNGLNECTLKLFQEDNKEPAEWTREFYYGMFIGRADPLRIRALHKHYNFVYKSFGLTSFNDDLREYMSKPELAEYFIESNQTYEEMCSIKTPYSEIDDIRKPPITPPYNTNGEIWHGVYKNIGIEIVCETNISGDGFDISEKLLRPMYYKKPFLVISAPNCLKGLREYFGFKTFNNFIPEDYDNYYGPTRVDRIFEILEELITNRTIFRLAEQCNDILEHNRTKVIEMIDNAKNK